LEHRSAGPLNPHALGPASPQSVRRGTTTAAYGVQRSPSAFPAIEELTTSQEDVRGGLLTATVIARNR